MKRNKKDTPWCYRILSLWFFALFFVLEISTAMAATWYVDDAGSGDGLSWATAYGDIETAITSAAAGDEIWTKQGTYPIATPIAVNKAITLYGGFPDAIASPVFSDRAPALYTTTVDGQDNVHHCFDLSGGGGATIDGLTITGGRHLTDSAPQFLGGGGITLYSSNNNTIRNCRFTGNTSDRGGAAISINESDGTTIENCTFDSNSVSLIGGALVTSNAHNTTVTDCSFTGNSSGEIGGAIYVGTGNSNDLITITGTLFNNNHAVMTGGAIYFSSGNGKYAISNCQFTTNYVHRTDYSAEGGAIYSSSYGGSTVSGCQFTGNYARADNSDNGHAHGGAVMINGASSAPAQDFLNDSTFTDNYTQGRRESKGGAVFISNIVHLTGCTFNGNKATKTTALNEDSQGGALFLHFDRGAGLVAECIFKNNSAYSQNSSYGAQGGAIYLNSSSPTIQNSLFTGNACQGFGGALYLNSSYPTFDATINNSTFTENYSYGRGGAIHNGGQCTPTITNSVIWNNSTNQISPSIHNEQTGYAPSINYSDIQDYTYPTPPGPGIGNLTIDPLFTTAGSYDTNGTANNITDDNWTEGDYKLQAGSTCLDSGTATDMPVVDLEGITRPQGTYHDIGTYERENSDPVSTLTASVNGGNGSVSPESGRYYTVDAIVESLTASPNQHYHIGAWTGTDDDSSTETTNSVTMDSDATVTVTFAIDTFTLTYLTDGNGTIDGTTPQTVDYNTDGTQVTALANLSYEFVNWSDAVATAARTESNVTTDLSVTANFCLLLPWYQDSDDDGYGNSAESLSQCTQPLGYVSDNTDCDDNDPDEYPGQTWYKDQDGDGYSDGTTSTSCERSTGFYLASELTATSGDCDDSDPGEYPGRTWYKDQDGDGYSDGTTTTSCERPAGYYLPSELTATSGDCNDSNPDEYPGQTWYEDIDQDGYSDGTSIISCERPVGYYLASELTAISGDNCPTVTNSDQADDDTNGIGNACEDDDDDGIAAPVDGSMNNSIFVDESSVFSNDFTDNPYGGVTFGSIDERADLSLTIGDSETSGVSISATGGTGTAMITLCNFDLAVTSGDYCVATCGSLILEVDSGPMEVYLSTTGYVSVPAGVTVKITETSHGTFSIDNQSGSESIIVYIGGKEIPIKPGENGVVTISFSWNLFMPAILGTDQQ